MNVAKIHRKLMITESQFYFASISATKARIFMKFYVVVNDYLVSLNFWMSNDFFQRLTSFQRTYFYQMSCTRDDFPTKISLKEHFWRDLIGV